MVKQENAISSHQVNLFLEAHHIVKGQITFTSEVFEFKVNEKTHI